MSKKFTSIAAEAWSNTKFVTDPEFDDIPNFDFKSKLQFAADKVISSGTALTNFEKEVAKIHAETDIKVADPGSPEYGGPMAVTEIAITNPGVGPGSDALDKAKAAAAAKAKATTEPTSAKPKAKTASVAAKAKDPSGHVATGKEAAAIVTAELTAPLHP